MIPDYKHIIEAVLMASEEPLTIKRLSEIFVEDMQRPSTEEIKAALASLQQDYTEHSLELIEVASGYCFRIKIDYAKWVTKLWESKPPRYSRTFLETLALIAYKQPITRAEIEQVRGVATSSQIIKTLIDRNWVKIVGHRDLPGKPALLATTNVFLDYFNLKNLADLPSLAQLQDFEKAGEQLEMQLQTEFNLEVAEIPEMV